MKKNLVVIGNGMAGVRVVEEILARGGHRLFDITMFGDEPYGNYNRILPSNVLNGTQQAEEIFLNPIEWYRENDITLHVGVYAESILRKAKCVLGADGSIEPYDKLIIATGSRSHVPSIEGVTLPDGQDKPGVFVFRTLDDCREIAAYAKGCRGRAAIIGGGLLGLEAARGLQSYGVQVDVIHRSQYFDESPTRRPGRRHPEIHHGTDGYRCAARQEHHFRSWRRPCNRPALRGRQRALARHGRDGSRYQT